jgi:hypothetical protein
MNDNQVQIYVIGGHRSMKFGPVLWIIPSDKMNGDTETNELDEAARLVSEAPAVSVPNSHFNLRNAT